LRLAEPPFGSLANRRSIPLFPLLEKPYYDGIDKQNCCGMAPPLDLNQ
jgi:hypothetical protein